MYLGIKDATRIFGYPAVFSFTRGAGQSLKADAWPDPDKKHRRLRKVFPQGLDNVAD